MSKTPNFDAKIKELLNAATVGEKVDSVTGEKWEMTQKDIDIYKRFNVPPMKVSQLTFFRQALLTMSGHSWWWNKHCETGKPLISHIHPSFPYKLVSEEEWHARDFSDINQDSDLSQSFFDQLYGLFLEVPMNASRNIEKPINSIARNSFGDEDSFFVNSSSTKRSFYCCDSFNIEDSSEITWSHNVNNSYNTVRAENINNCRVVRESNNCINCDFIFDCRDCEFVFMSANKRHKKYIWRNEQLDKAEWEKRYSELDFGDYKVFNNLYQEFKENVDGKFVWPENFNINCHDCENCFGCHGLKNKKFHIFNKPYNEEEYWQRVDELKTNMLERGEYGEFFPQEFNLVGMQFSTTSVFYGVDNDEVKKLGGLLYDPDKGTFLAPKKTDQVEAANIDDVPDCIKEVDESWVGKSFMDKKVNRKWAVVEQEYKFLQEHKLPFPREHYTSRLRNQILLLNAPESEDISCYKCNKPLKIVKNNTFTKRNVYCKECYLKYLEENN